MAALTSISTAKTPVQEALASLNRARNGLYIQQFGFRNTLNPAFTMEMLTSPETLSQISSTIAAVDAAYRRAVTEAEPLFEELAPCEDKRIFYIHAEEAARSLDTLHTVVLEAFEGKEGIPAPVNETIQLCGATSRTCKASAARFSAMYTLVNNAIQEKESAERAAAIEAAKAKMAVKKTPAVIDSTALLDKAIRRTESVNANLLDKLMFFNAHFVGGESKDNLTSTRKQQYLLALIDQLREMRYVFLEEQEPLIGSIGASSQKGQYYERAIDTSQLLISVYSSIEGIFSEITSLQEPYASILSDAREDIARSHDDITRLTALRDANQRALTEPAIADAPQISGGAGRDREVAPVPAGASLLRSTTAAPRVSAGAGRDSDAAPIAATKAESINPVEEVEMTGEITFIFSNREHLPRGHIEIRGQVPGQEGIISWDSSNPVRLDDGEDPALLTMRMPRFGGVDYPFKLVLVQEDGTVRWQDGDDNLKISSMPQAGSSSVIEIIFQ